MDSDHQSSQNSATALDLLKEVMNEFDGDPWRASEMGGDEYCVFCNEWKELNDGHHAADCVYVKAAAFLDGASA